MKRKRCIKAITLLVSVCLMAGICCRQVSAGEKAYSGSSEIGPISWSYDTETKKLTISGSGTLDGGGSGVVSPKWWRWADEIKILEINGDVQKIITPFAPERGLMSMEALILPDSLKEIRGEVFKNAENLKSVTFPPNLQVIRGEAFYNCSRLKRVTLPNRLKEINVGLFCNCDSLTSVQIPDRVTAIKYLAFSGTRLKQVTIPKNVETIGTEAFDLYPYKCLKKVTIKSKKIKKWGKNIFGVPSKKLVIEVPKSKKKVYKKELRSKGLPKYVKIVGKKSLDK